ncbi:MAG: O-antigen ligase domain-containing protein, partial [Bradyrhizobium sp.]|nr:O-antigen ligase domain-containing protein [Bradyrhizobium sp.]
MARSFQLWLTLGAFGLAPLFFGSVDQLATAIWVVVLSLGVILGLSIPLGPRQARLLLVFLVGCGFYA